ncbi:MAG: RluA family pseudouridine synthase [Treponema sp.]|nr:RluA family pseudouridine synthase [Treponema sp.]
MFPPFPQKKAHEACKKLISLLNEGSARIVPIARESEARRNQGIMIGALACTNPAGTSEISLVTISGVSHTLEFDAEKMESRDLTGESGNETSCRMTFVPPVVEPGLIEQALEKNDGRIHELTALIQNLKAGRAKGQAASEQEQAYIQERKALTGESLQNVYGLYSFYCADGNMRSLNSICKERIKGALPPTGTGECCAPKLLHYAYSHNLMPVSMCEVFYEKGMDIEKAEPCPPCTERCGIILPEMLGLEILYRDEHIIVVNKQSGLLSVPGRGPDKQDCIVSRVKRLFPQCIEQPAVHRLDMETSGILILAFTKEAHKRLNKQFEDGLVKKQYEALLDGVLAKKGIPQEGQSELYFRLDIDNRPHQIWDETYGKKAITQWKCLNVEDYTAPDGKRRAATRVLFIPHTGRTHQLRLASADSHGFGIPIIGDTLYGTCEPGERLMLHATHIEFEHPATGQKMTFDCPAPF